MQVIDIFKELCTIEHCSHNAGAMRSFLLQKAVLYGYETAVDDAGNILCHVPGSKVTLQSHYDMVCIGDFKSMVLAENDGWLSANDSTLGADNGIGMAMMLALMAEGEKVDALFTAEEEVGLIGARQLDVPLQTPFLLNLDSEEEGIVTVGCAGGMDIIATLPLRTQEKELFGFEVEIGGLPGGHSGVDIDKGIPNAIKELAALLGGKGLGLCEISGGERRNAIAKHALAVVASEEEGISVSGARPLGKKQLKVFTEGEKVFAMLNGFRHGVWAHDEMLGIVETSINLALVGIVDETLRIQMTARSMRLDRLEETRRACIDYFESYGCRVDTEEFYPPWKPETEGFASDVLEACREIFPDARFGAIHAGLECGIIKDRYPDVEMASIGPNILYPHSTREKVELASVERVFGALRAVVAMKRGM